MVYLHRPALLCALALAESARWPAAAAFQVAPPTRPAALLAKPSAPSRSASTRMEAPKGVVITGAAGGVGYAYAEEFLRQGHWVVICDVKDPEPAVQALKAKFADGRISGIAADVSSPESVADLAKFAKQELGTVHYWINNAGINGGRRPFLSLSPQTISAVVKVNLIGVLLCTAEAAKLMQEQKGVQGHIFNTVGSGVKGGGTPGYAAYGATKRGLPQLMNSLVKELDEGVEGYDTPKPLGKANVHTLSPGMVFTEMLLNDSTPKLRKFPFGVLAAQPPEVAQDLVPKILATTGNGKLVEFLTQDRILTKFFERFIQGKKSEFVDDDGNVIRKEGAEYSDNGVRQPYSGGSKWTPE